MPTHPGFYSLKREEKVMNEALVFANMMLIGFGPIIAVSISRIWNPAIGQDSIIAAATVGICSALGLMTLVHFGLAR